MGSWAMILGSIGGVEDVRLRGVAGVMVPEL